jgi:hypothetical protein
MGALAFISCALNLFASGQSSSAAGAYSALTRGGKQGTIETYESWIASFKGSDVNKEPEDGHKVQLAITIIDGDELEPDMKTAKMFGAGYRISTTASAVSIDGMVTVTRYTSMGVQGGGSVPLPKQDFRKLQPLIEELPDDHGKLPPKGRRLVVQALTPNGVLVRAYDRANVPDSVLEMLRLVGADASPIFPFPEFQPNERWKKDDFGLAGIELGFVGLNHANWRLLAVSPDGRLKVLDSAGYYDPTVHIERLKDTQNPTAEVEVDSFLQIRDSRSDTVLQEFRRPMIGRGITSTYSARFTPDGRYLLLLSSVPDMRIYETATWRLLDQLPGVPVGAVAYYPSADWKYGVAVYTSGEVRLVESTSGRSVARIDLGDEMQSASFSPDCSRVAVVTVGPDDHNFATHLRVWDSRTGSLVSELRPLEETPRDTIGEPVWWPGGKYLLAPSRNGRSGPSVVGIWNVDSGRYRGALAGCGYIDTPGPQVLMKGSMLYKSCGYDELLMWEVDGDIQKIADFENSLSR